MMHYCCYLTDIGHMCSVASRQLYNHSNLFYSSRILLSKISWNSMSSQVAMIADQPQHKRGSLWEMHLGQRNRGKDNNQRMQLTMDLLMHPILPAHQIFQSLDNICLLSNNHRLPGDQTLRNLASINLNIKFEMSMYLWIVIRYNWLATYEKEVVVGYLNGSIWTVLHGVLHGVTARY